MTTCLSNHVSRSQYCIDSTPYCVLRAYSAFVMLKQRPRNQKAAANYKDWEQSRPSFTRLHIRLPAPDQTPVTIQQRLYSRHCHMHHITHNHKRTRPLSSDFWCLNPQLWVSALKCQPLRSGTHQANVRVSRRVAQFPGNDNN